MISANRVASRFLIASYFNVETIVLYGKWKNHRGKVVGFGSDKYGNPTVEIEPIPKGRKSNKILGLYRIWRADVKEKALAEKEKTDVSTLRVAARFQMAARPVPIDKKGIAQFVEKELVPGIVHWLKQQPHQDESLGVQTLGSSDFEVESVDGQEILLAEVLIKSVAAKGKWAAVLGGSSGNRRWESGQGKVKVTLWLNGALTPADFLVPQPGTDRLQPLSRCTYETCLPYGLYSILIHELTHTAESMFQKVPEYLRGVDNPMAEKPREYVNDPQEVRAFMQQVVDEAVKGAEHLRSHAKSNQWLVNYSLRMSTTWKIIEPDMTHANKAKILKAIYEAFEKEGLLLDDNMAIRVAARFEKFARYKEKKKVRSEDGGITTLYLYSDQAIAERNKNKAKRLEKLRGKIHKLTAQVRKDLKSEDPEICLVALAVACINESAERVGNEVSAKGERNDSGKPHVGVTGWKKDHISFKNGTAVLNYIGKSGIKQHKVISDKTIVSALKNAYEGCTEDSLFSYEGGKVDAARVNHYLAKFGVTAKDLRGLRANEAIIKTLKAIRNKNGELPKDKKKRKENLKKEFDTAIDEVSDLLGNEAKTLASQYLVPGLENQFKLDGTVLEKLTEAL